MQSHLSSWFWACKRLVRGVLICTLGLLSLLMTLPAQAEDAVTQDSESKVKAAYLYKFAQYIDWPPQTFAKETSPIAIGVIGADDVADALTRVLVGRVLNNRPLTMRLIKPGEPVVGVQILFIGKGESSHLKDVLDTIQAQPILTVTEAAGALNAGSVINFVPVGDHIRFEISLIVAQRNGLKLSSRLLVVAQQVQTGAP